MSIQVLNIEFNNSVVDILSNKFWKFIFIYFKDWKNAKRSYDELTLKF